jgi:hypothetical protein
LGIAETYTADKHKMANPPPAKENVCLVLGDKIAFSSAKTLPSKLRRTLKTKRQAMVGTGTRKWYCPAEEGPPIDVDTVGVVHEAFHPSPQMAHLQPNIFFK